MFHMARAGQNSGSYKYSIKDIFVHPKYNGDYKGGHDIAVLSLKEKFRPVNFSWLNPCNDVHPFGRGLENQYSKSTEDIFIEMNGYPADADKIGY